MMALIMAVAYLTSVYFGLRTKIRILARHVLWAASRLCSIPVFGFMPWLIAFGSSFSVKDEAYRASIRCSKLSASKETFLIHKFLEELL